jgi:uncharacterized protein (TIGR03089 family)
VLHELTAGLAADRDPSTPLLTLYDGPARVELSTATVANWVGKTANLLTDVHGAPVPVGICLPVHWLGPCLLLGAVAAGCPVVVAQDPATLAGCEVAVVHVDAADVVGCPEVYVSAGHPLGARASGVAFPLLDLAVELPTHGDSYTRQRPTSWDVATSAGTCVPLPGFTGADRVLVVGDPASVLPAVLGALAAGASLVLLADGDPTQVAHAERVTVTVGCDVAALRRAG